MPVHDWSRVEGGILHDFHGAWIIALRNVLNGGLLPHDFYCLAEQHLGKAIADVLTLHVEPAGDSREKPTPTGGIAVAEAPPKVRKKLIAQDPGRLRKKLAVRHVSNHRLVALIEIVSPANKDRTAHVRDFVAKAVGLLAHGVHLLVVDLFRPGRHDPGGLNGCIRRELAETEYAPPEEEPLTLASYASGPAVEAYVEHAAFGADLPDMPHFLEADLYVPVPLQAAYREAYAGTPEYWRGVLEKGE